MNTVAPIELKISIEQLKEVYMAIDFDNPEITFTGEKVKTMKSYYSLLEHLRLKLAKKVLASQNKTKPFKLSLAYYEANCLHKTLMVVYLNRHAQLFFNQLDQKLA